MRTHFSYRRAGVKDLPAIARSRADDPDAGPADERMAAYLDGSHHPHQALAPRASFVCEVSGVVVGYIAGHLTTRHRCDGEVQYLYVAPAHRRTGVAAHLLSLQAEWFVEQGARKVCVNADPDNTAAIAFYTRRGATPLGRAWFVWADIGALSKA
jgi:ribosomal protein S18 acetylase RimI-like enzyme